MIHKVITIHWLAIIILWASAEARGQQTMTPQNLFDIQSVAEVSISPDQNFIAFTLNVPRPFDHPSGSDYRELYLYDVKEQKSMPFITGSQSITSIGWNPAGDAITFRAGMDDLPGVQVYAINVDGGSHYPLTRFNGNVGSYEFIDHQNLAIVSAEPADPAIQQRRQKGFDLEVFEEEFRHLALYRYNLQDHKAVALTRGVTVFDFTISPDGRYAAAAIAPRNLVDDRYMFKRIHLIDLTTGETTKIMENPGKLGHMAWSPDGTKLAFASASKREDSVVGSLFVMDVPTSKTFEELRNVVKDMELSVNSFAWKDNNTLLYAAEEGVDIVLSEQRLDKPSRTILLEPSNVVLSGFHHVDGMVAFAGNTWQHPSELFTFNLKRKDLVRHTNHNEWLSQVELAPQRKLVYDARDGKDIEGVLLYPLNYDESKKYPLIVYIHGGPEAAVKNGWSTAYNRWGQIAAARDYFVFMPNYRSSSGRGVDFTMAGYGDLVGVEYDDVLDGIDHLIDIGYVDSTRVGMGGGSYGGYFSAWSATRHTERFAASVVFVGISNQVSKRNTTDIPWEDHYVHWGYWNHENHEDVYGRSPIKYAHQSKTPTLILAGDKDPRIHPSQSLELYRALKMHAQAPVRLIWYHGEGHGNRRNTHRLDYLVRTMDWFDHFLKNTSEKEMPAQYPDYGF